MEVQISEQLLNETFFREKVYDENKILILKIGEDELIDLNVISERETLPLEDEMKGVYKTAIPLLLRMKREERVSVPELVLVTSTVDVDIISVMFEIVTSEDPLMVNAVELSETFTPSRD